nr:polymorphic toxin type 24 domain-containing protein [Pseudomonas qingdaonensis]
MGWVDPLGLEGCEKACKSRNKPPPPMEASEGRPHSIFERPGVDGQYTTHYWDGTWKEYRGSGKDHGNIPRPNIKEATKNPTPDGRVFIPKVRVRTPLPHEAPTGE